VVLVALAVTLRAPTLDQPLVEAHGFRQTQTGYTAVLYHERGVNPLHTWLPVLGEPFEVPFEFPLFQVIAVLPMMFGASPEIALRGAGLMTFIASALLLYGLIRHVADWRAALASLAVFLFVPFGILWGRTSAMEFLATAGAVAWLWMGLWWRERRQLPWAGLSLAGGLLVMLVKPTTGAFWFLPLLLHRPDSEERGWASWLRARRDPVLLGLIAIPFLAGLLWTRHADAVKAANPFTTWLTSRELWQWTYGTPEQRLAIGEWGAIASRAEDYLTGIPAWQLPLLLTLGLTARNAPFWAGLALAGVLPILVFFNLYSVHDYYLAAALPVTSAFLGLGAAWLWERRRSIAFGTPLVLCVLALWSGAITWTGRPYWETTFRRIDSPARTGTVAELIAHTTPDDRIVVEGQDWNPQLFFYARRSGVMLPGRVNFDHLLPGLVDRGYRFLLSSGLSPGTIRLLEGQPWTGVLGNQLLVMGDRPDQLRRAPLMATNDPATLQRLAGERVLNPAPIVVACGAGPVVVTRGGAATWLVLRPGDPQGAVLRVGATLSPVPTRPVVVAGAAAGELALTCSGAAEIVIDKVIDAPPP
jgi:hypothetical protein